MGALVALTTAQDQRTADGVADLVAVASTVQRVTLAANALLALLLAVFIVRSATQPLRHAVDVAPAVMADKVRLVSDIVDDISGASREQSMGVGQVGEAAMQMDQTPLQNAALVEPSAAAAASRQCSWRRRCRCSRWAARSPFDVGCTTRAPPK